MDMCNVTDGGGKKKACGTPASPGLAAAGASATRTLLMSEPVARGLRFLIGKGAPVRKFLDALFKDGSSTGGVAVRSADVSVAVARVPVIASLLRASTRRRLQVRLVYLQAQTWEAAFYYASLCHPGKVLGDVV